MVNYYMSKSLVLPAMLFFALLCKSGVICQEEKRRMAAVDPLVRTFLERRSPSNFFTYFLSQSGDDDENYMKAIEEEEEQKRKDLLNAGPLRNRRFVSVSVLPRSQKVVERTYRFDYEDEDDFNQREKREDEPSTTGQPQKIETEIGRELNERERPQDSLNKNDKDKITKTPNGFTTNRVVIRYDPHLTAVEKAGDSSAKLGDKCQPTTTLEPDICERAAYPNKNKMVCNSVDDPAMNKTLKKSTCVCKFYRVSESTAKWKQMKQGQLTIDDRTVETCLVPKFGVCNHRIPTGLSDTNGNPVYEVDVCQGHFQCDNSNYYQYLKNDTGAGGNGIMVINKHCTEDDFLSHFEDVVRDKILVCSKPHPRRFSNYDEYKFYCLPRISRDEQLKHYRPSSESIDLDSQDVLTES